MADMDEREWGANRLIDVNINEWRAQRDLELRNIKTPFQDRLRVAGACPTARIWVGKRTLKEAWEAAGDDPEETLQHAGWMLWLIEEANIAMEWRMHEDGRLALLNGAVDEGDCDLIKVLVPYDMIRNNLGMLDGE